MKTKNFDYDIPKTIDILGTEYTVERIERNDYLIKNDVDAYVDFSTKTIIIDKQEPLENGIRGWSTYRLFMHEVIHAYFFEAGHTKYTQDENLIEALVVLIPKLVHELCENTLKELVNYTKSVHGGEPKPSPPFISKLGNIGIDDKLIPTNPNICDFPLCKPEQFDFSKVTCNSNQPELNFNKKYAKYKNSVLELPYEKATTK